MDILLIEDEADDRLLVKKALAQGGGGEYRIREAESLESAAAQVGHPPPDLVLLDLNLPDSNGIDTLSRLHDENPRIPILVLTGLDDQELAVQVLRKGAQEFLNKSDITPGALERAVAHTIEQKRMQDELVDTNARLEEALDDLRITSEKLQEAQVHRMQLRKIEALGTLSGGIAREFGSLFKTLWEVVSQQRANPGGFDTDLLQQAEQACLSGQALTTQLARFASPGEPRLQPMLIQDCIQECADNVLSDSPVGCRIRTREEIASVWADHAQMNMVCTVLLFHCLELSDEPRQLNVDLLNRSIDPETSDRVPFLSPGHYVEVRLRNPGVSITPEEADEIFDALFSSHRRMYGLGMATAFSIVVQHQGHITARALQEENALEFSLLVPATKDPSETRPSTPRILIVDDEADLAGLVLKMVRRRGLEGVTAATADEACQQCRDAVERGTPFAAALIDLHLSEGASGTEALKALREIDPALRAIAISGYPADPERPIEDQGFDAYLEKPFQAQSLWSTLSGVLPES